MLAFRESNKVIFQNIYSQNFRVKTIASPGTLRGTPSHKQQDKG